MTETFDPISEDAEKEIFESPKNKKQMKKIDEHTEEQEKLKEIDRTTALRAISFCENPGWNYNMDERDKKFENINDCIVSAINENEKECREFLEELEEEKA